MKYVRRPPLSNLHRAAHLRPSGLTASLAAAGLALMFPAGLARAQFYSVTDLGTLGGSNCLAYSINNHGQIAGASQIDGGSFHAFLFNGGDMMDAGTLGGSNSRGWAVNDHGWMVGAADTAGAHSHAFVCTNLAAMPMMRDLGTLGGSNSAACMINARGDVAGWTAMANGSHHAFFMTNAGVGHMMDMGTAGGTNAEAYCLNSNRMMVGFTMISNLGPQPFMSTNAMLGGSGMMTMGMGNMGASGGQSWSINDLGQVIGQAQMGGGRHHAFVSSGSGGGMMGGMMGRTNLDLGTLGGSNSVGYCLNNTGTAAGMAELTNGRPHAFMLSNALSGMAEMMDLNRSIPTNSGWELMVAHGMNEAGQIVGWGMHAGRTNAFLLTPVTAPLMMTSAPLPQLVGPGASVTLQMGMSASEPVSYQWWHDGVAMPGATNATLMLPGMSAARAGEYTVTAHNAVGMVARGSAAVSMLSMASSNGVAHLSLTAPRGTRFTLETSDRLGAGASWQGMTNLTATGGTSQVTEAVPAGRPARFYRVTMLP